MNEQHNNTHASIRRAIRVFISSTFRDMMEERDEMMTHAWPELRRFCQERHVELVEVDLRWGIAEEQSTRKETLKLCLDEIKACRPFFIGLLGERYGWVPGEDAFTADLQEEQPWLLDNKDKSVTELEIMHGVLNNPEMAGRAFFYFRDPAYAQGRGPDFLSGTTANANKQTMLKEHIRTECAEKGIPLCETYPDPVKLTALVLEDLKTAIEAQFPVEDVPDALTREAQDHEAFAEIRRRTYIGRAEYIEALDKHAIGDGGPIVLLGDSGSGKSALLANWIEHWRKANPNDFIIQHYIGGTADSSDHWRLMTRVMNEIKRWSDDSETVPTKHDDIREDFPLWLAKARARAEHEGVKFILVLDALNQLDEQDHARLLGWLPEYPFNGPLRLIVSTLPGKKDEDDPLAVIQQRGWQQLRVQPLNPAARHRMISRYLRRFGKKLDKPYLRRLATAPATANPLYLKILLDDLRVTGTFDLLDERLTEYLKATDIPTLLQQVLARYTRDYDRDRKGLVAEVLGLIYASRRGLSETEILQLLRPVDQAQLPPVLWTPLRAALEDSLVDRGGILNFAHDFLHTAVGYSFAADKDRRAALHLHLADYFEAQPITARTCEELPYQLLHAEAWGALQHTLWRLDMLDAASTAGYEKEWVTYWMKMPQGHRNIIAGYQASLAALDEKDGLCLRLADCNRQVAYVIGVCVHAYAALPFFKQAVKLQRASPDTDPRLFAETLGSVGHCYTLLVHSEWRRRPEDAEEESTAEDYFQQACLHYQEALAIYKMLADTLGIIDIQTATGVLYHYSGRLSEAKQVFIELLEKWLPITPSVPRSAVLSNLAHVYKASGRSDKAISLYKEAITMQADILGWNNSRIAITLKNLAVVYASTKRFADALPLYRKVIEIRERQLGASNPLTKETIREAEECERSWQCAEEILDKALPEFLLVLSRAASRSNITEILDKALPEFLLIVIMAILIVTVAALLIHFGVIRLDSLRR